MSGSSLPEENARKCDWLTDAEALDQLQELVRHRHQPGEPREWSRADLDCLAPERPRTDSPYLTSEQAADYCQLAVKTIYNHRNELRPQPGIGKPLYTREELDRWLSTRRKKRTTNAGGRRTERYSVAKSSASTLGDRRWDAPPSSRTPFPTRLGSGTP